MESFTDEWLKANGHDKQWLEDWLAEPKLDVEAVKEWFEIHKWSDPRLIVANYSPLWLESFEYPLRRSNVKQSSARRTYRLRKASRKRTPFPCSKMQKLQRFALFGNHCAYCGRSGRMSADHVIPLSKGGLDEAVNIVPACSPCNSSKHAKPVEDWYKSQAFFSQSRWEKIQKHCQSTLGPPLTGGLRGSYLGGASSTCHEQNP